MFGFEVIQNTMSKDRFELLLKFYHFSNNQEEHAEQNRLFKLRPLLGNYFYRRNNATIERETFVQTIYSWKSAQIWRQDIQASGY